jgi:PhnB protein
MATLQPYFNFSGNTEEAFNFYKSVFGGEFTTFTRFEDNPGACEGIPVSELRGVMHVSLPIGTSTVLMGSDVPSSMQKAINGTNISISIDTESEAEADQLFTGLGEGGNIQMPLQKMFWGAYFGMLTDKFGIQWMVNYDEKPLAN